MAAPAPILEISNIHISHDNSPTLKGVDLSLYRGEILCLLGPSGCGKTTLLRIIAGLEKPHEGAVFFEKVNLKNMPPYRRKFSMMFQEFALFPHKNVYDNIAFGLQMQKLSSEEVKQRAEEMIELVGLTGKEKRDINDLSGGERQRVALARSLAPRPRLLMLDEPMGSLDRSLRERLVLDLRQILKKVNATAIFVTHDQNEAFVLADRVAVFNKGYIEQIGTPEEVFKHPENEFVARFLGFQNLLPFTLNQDNGIETDLGVIDLDRSTIPSMSGKTLLLIRPDAARTVSEESPTAPGEVEVECQVIDSRFQGSVYQVQMALAGGSSFVFLLPADSAVPQAGGSLSLALKTSAMTLV